MVFGGVAMMILSQFDASFEEERWVYASRNDVEVVTLKRDED
jgi:hypothetical protein